MYIVGSKPHVYDGFVFAKEKRLNPMSSKDSHGHALFIFLQAVNLSKSCFDVSQTFKHACNIYFHMKKKQYVLSSDERKCKHFCCIDQLNTGLQQVCTYVKVHCIHIMLIYVDHGRHLWCGWYGHGRTAPLSTLHSNTLMLLYKSAKK